MLSRPNLQSRTAVDGRMAAEAGGGGKLLVLCRHCRSVRRTTFPPVSWVGAREGPQSMTEADDDEDLVAAGASADLASCAFFSAGDLLLKDFGRD